MKAETGRLRTLREIVAAVALLTAPPMASASSGGMIHFAGAIVAPYLQMTVDAAPVGVAGAQAARVGSLTLTFSAAPGVTAGADVTLRGNDGAQARDLVAARFVDGGARVAAARNGHYRVGRDGGVLSLSPAHAEKDTCVTVVVSYD